jgi:putative PEP-CTERM system TPR-repeat lipoprotein
MDCRMRTPRLTLAAVALAALLAACGGPRDPQALTASARELAAANDHPAAIIQLKNALQQQADLTEARFLLGRSLLATGDAAGAVIELRRARERGHPDREVVPLLALALLGQGQHERLQQEFGALTLDDAPAQAELKVTLAQSHAARGQREALEAAVAAALQAQPAHAGARVLKARLVAGRGDFDGAARIADEVIAQHPRDIGAWLLRADLLLAVRNDRDGALDAFRKVVDIDPRNLQGHAGALAVLFARNDPAQVRPQLEQLRKAHRNHPQTQFFDAQLAFMERDFKRTRELVQALLRQTPDNVRVLQLAGALELQDGTALQAQNHLGRAVQLAPDLLLARQLLAQAQLRGGQAERALDTLAPALAANPPQAATYALAAEAHLLTGNAERAHELFGRAARLNPQDLRSRAAVALGDIARGRVAEGFAELEAAAAEDRTGSVADLALISAHLMRREFEPALQAIARLEQKQPGQPLAANLRGRVQVAQRQLDAARASFEQSLKIDPLYFPAAAALAALDFEAGNPQAARERFQGLLQRDPRNVPALLALAELGARTGASREELTRHLSAAVAAAPDAPRPRLLLIEHHLRGNEGRLALPLAQSGVSARPDNAELLDALGRVQIAVEDRQQALATFNKLASMQPRSPLPHLRIAGVHLAANNEASARQSLRRALQIAPRFLPAQQQLLALDMAARRPDDALTIARTIQRQRPNEAVGFVLEGDIRAAQRNFAAAAAAYRSALTKTGDRSEAAVKLHAMLRGANRMPEAQRFAADWQRDHPRDARFRLHLGDVALFTQDYATAETHYRAALAIAPDNAIVLNNVAWTMARQGKPGAVDYAERALRLAPAQAAIMDTLGYALSQAGQHERAIEVQRRAVAAQPQMHLYKLTLAHIYIQAGRRTEATRTLDELAALGERFAGQAEVERLRQQLRGG